MKKLGIIGLWHQGIVGAACMSSMGYDVIAYDKDANKIALLNQGKSPIFEPGLDELLHNGICNKQLLFTNELSDVTFQCQDIMIMFDTPVDEDDNLDLSEILITMKMMALNLMDDCLLFFTSQMPVGTCDLIEDIIKNENQKATFNIVYSPENLRLGQAIERFMHPPLPVIGANNDYAFKRACSLLSPLNTEWKYVNIRTAEMIKHALNAYIGLTICFGNEIGNICDEVGADGHKIAELLKLEDRVGKKAMLFPGLGFSGGTIARDLQTLRRLAVFYKLDTSLFDGIWESNRNHNGIVIRKLLNIFGNLKNIPIAVLGLTYKPDTNTLRRSLSLEIIRSLIKEGALIKTNDPKADRTELSKYDDINFCEDPYEAIINCKVLLLLTTWNNYKNLDFLKVKNIMNANPIIFDVSSFWNGSELEKLGFNYISIGSGKRIKEIM